MNATKTKSKASQPDIEWTGYADDDEVQAYADSINEGRADGAEHMMTLEEAQSAINEDSDYWNMQWEDFTSYLTELMREKCYWYATATNMGWQSRSGSKVFKAENGAEFLREISPNTDCHYTIHKTGQGFRVRIGHHDAPMGEHHVVKALTDAQYERMSA